MEGLKRVTLKTAGGNIMDITHDEDAVISPYWITPTNVEYLHSNNIIVRNLDSNKVQELLDAGVIKRNENYGLM